MLKSYLLSTICLIFFLNTPDPGVFKKNIKRLSKKLDVELLTKFTGYFYDRSILLIILEIDHNHKLSFELNRIDLF